MWYNKYVEIGTHRKAVIMKDINKVVNLTGKRFGRLTVIGLDDKEGRKTYWVCQCDCGNIKSVRSDSLQARLIRSCGCLKNEQDKKNLTANHSHKMSGTRMYNIWQGMKGRCNNIHDARYHSYGGRGIKVCQEWEDNFAAFSEWALNNGYAENLTIDRINNDKGYSPDNCRWIDNKTQSNNRRSNIKITIGNATKTLTEWCKIFELDSKVIFARYERCGFISIDQLFN